MNKSKNETEVMYSLKKISCLCIFLILLLCSACGNTEIPFTTEDNQESSQASAEVPSNQNIDVVLQDKLTQLSQHKLPNIA